MKRLAENDECERERRAKKARHKNALDLILCLFDWSSAERHIALGCNADSHLRILHREAPRNAARFWCLRNLCPADVIWSHIAPALVALQSRFFYCDTCGCEERFVSPDGRLAAACCSNHAQDEEPRLACSGCMAHCTRCRRGFAPCCIWKASRATALLRKGGFQPQRSSSSSVASVTSTPLYNRNVEELQGTEL